MMESTDKEWNQSEPLSLKKSGGRGAKKPKKGWATVSQTINLVLRSAEF